ncbi:MAG: helix-turn-helix transcriptional regulator [Bacteroidales bacterium]|nr:helix-turn-helix transcriptional regulator [Bacteroidales bacterium]
MEHIDTMSHAYHYYYLEDAMNNLGSMLDYAVNAAHCDVSMFFEIFLASGVASQIEIGNPRYVSGLSGVELYEMVLRKSSDFDIKEIDYQPFERTKEFWAGWSLAYYQWFRAKSFLYIQHNGLDIKRIISMYPTLHEADLSKFVEVADGIIDNYLAERPNVLKTIRKQARLTQQRLAEISGVTLRMIQAYEQGDQDIRKAEAQTVFALSKALGCSPETII